MLFDKLNSKFTLMNEVLLNIFFRDRQNRRFLKENLKEYQYIYLGDSLTLFENLFYPYIVRLSNTQQLEKLFGQLSDTEKEILIQLPEQFLTLTILEITIIDEGIENEILELKCFERIIKSYRHQEFFELLLLFPLIEIIH